MLVSIQMTRSCAIGLKMVLDLQRCGNDVVAYKKCTEISVIAVVLLAVVKIAKFNLQ